MDAFSLANGNGNSQTIYTYNEKRALALGFPDLSIPPEPPQGIFHARFNSGRFIEGVPPGQAKKKMSIKVKDVSFPLTLRWNIQAGNKIQYWLLRPGQGGKVPMNGSGSITLDQTDGGGMLIIEAQASQPCDPY
jgi:hypothetical protein